MRDLSSEFLKTRSTLDLKFALSTPMILVWNKTFSRFLA